MSLNSRAESGQPDNNRFDAEPGALRKLGFSIEENIL
ncbi:unnamed protein product, partial [marine sediment metagenome]